MQRAHTPPQEHPRVHLDLVVDDAAEQSAEIERLVGLGATRVGWDSYPAVRERGTNERGRRAYHRRHDRATLVLMARLELLDPGLPIKLGSCGNGEFQPQPANAVAQETQRRANAAVDRGARRVGLSRRQFLRSSLGAATTLVALAACTRESGQTGGT